METKKRTSFLGNAYTLTQLKGTKYHWDEKFQHSLPAVMTQVNLCEEQLCWHSHLIF